MWILNLPGAFSWVIFDEEHLAKWRINMTGDRIKEYTLKITQSSPTGLIVVLYDLAIEYIGDAKRAYAEGNHEEYRKECMNALKVINDLSSSLDFTYELAMPLFRVYEYMAKELSMAVIKNNTEGLDRVERYLSMIKGSFEKIAETDKGGPIMGNTQTVYAGLTYGKGVLNENISSDGNRGYKV